MTTMISLNLTLRHLLSLIYPLNQERAIGDLSMALLISSVRFGSVRSVPIVNLSIHCKHSFTQISPPERFVNEILHSQGLPRHPRILILYM